MSLLKKIWYMLESFLFAVGSYDPWSKYPAEVQGMMAAERLAFMRAAKQAQRRGQ